MTWFDQVEQKRKLLVAGVITICAIMLALTARRTLGSFDTYWHLQTGLDWIKLGLSPWIDHYSFTFQGQEISHQPFIFQALIAWLVDSYGLEPGFEIFKLFSFLLSFVLITYFLRRLRSPALIYLLVLPLFVVMIQLRSYVRPEIISYSFSIIAIIFYHRAQGRVSARSMLPIALLMLVWSNYHTSILGYVVFFGFFIDAAVLQLREKVGSKTWGLWLLWGIIILGVGFLNKGMNHPVIGALSFAPEWKEFIQEYKSATTYSNVKAIYALIILTATTLILSAKQNKFGYMIITGVLTFNAVSMARLVAPCGIIILCIFASLINEVDLKKLVQQQRPTLRWILGLAVSLIIVASLYSSIINTRWILLESNRTSAHLLPESITEYMVNNQIKGNIFNLFGLGGFLIYSLTPESQVYLDGRTNILYPIEHHVRYTQAKNNPEILKEEIDKYGINLAILENNPHDYSVVHQTGVFGLDFVGAKYSLFTTNEPNFPIAGRLLANPACWKQEDLGSLEAELLKAHTNLPVNSSLIQPLGLIVMYSQTANKRQFLTRLENATVRNVHQLRFSAYQALSLNLPQVSAALFEKMKYWEHRDFLSAALTYVQLNNWDRAEEIIGDLNSVDWPYVSETDLYLQYRILELIKQNDTLQLISDQHFMELSNQIKLFSITAKQPKLDSTLICTN